MKKWNFKWILSGVLVLSFFLQVNGQNLLTNPDAETGNTQGWVDPDDAWSADAPVTPHSGNYLFWPARKDIPYTEMYQDVDVSSYASAINGNGAWFNLTGWLANWDQYPHDRATLAIEALDAGGSQLLYLSRDHRSPVWTQYQIEDRIPPQTTTLRVHLIATRFVGSDNDGYFDDLSLRVSTTAPTIYVTVSAPNDQKEIAVDNTLQLSAQTVGGTDEGYIWSSSFDAIATVDSNGLVTAHQSGRFTIQATGKNTGKTGYLELTAYNTNDIIFIAPESEEEWTANAIHEIRWEVKGNLTNGTLSYSCNGGVDWIEIANIDSLQSGHYFWLVPDSTTRLNDCYLKLDWGDGQAVSAKFSIVPNATAIGRGFAVHHPADFELLPLYPNPFNPSTGIRFKLSRSVRVTVAVYDASGHLVTTLLNGQKAAGTYEIKWNAASLSSGIYFVQLQAGHYRQVRKAVLLK